MDKILVTNIQRFSLHDGPGIRTTVFLKGCSLHCPWCCNPENISAKEQQYMKNGKYGVYGQYYSTEGLYQEIIKDINFYGGNDSNFVNWKLEDMPGGVTFSGGECLLQIEQIQFLLGKLEEKHIHKVVETCLFVSEEQLTLALKYVDLFYVDIKILNEDRCKFILGGSIVQYLRNLEILMRSGKPVVFRVPVIGEYTDDEDNISHVVELIKKYAFDKNADLLKIELIKEHNLGLTKYQSLMMCNPEIKLPAYVGVSDEFMEKYKKRIDDAIEYKVDVEICRV